MKLVIEKATLKDCKILAQFNKMLIDDGGCINPMLEDALETRMRQFLETGYVAFFFVVNGIKIGYGLVDVGRKPCFIRHFYVADNYRRKGYGTQAFKQIIETLNVTELDLTVLVQNEIGYKFWTSCGLIPYEIVMHYRNNSNS